MAASSAVHSPNVFVMSVPRFCRYINWRREELGRTWDYLADAGGVPVNTLKDMAEQERIHPTITVENFSRLLVALGLIFSEESLKKLKGFPGTMSAVNMLRARSIWIEPITPIVKH